MENEIQIKKLEEKHVAYISFVGNYIGNAEIFKSLFNQLCGWAGPKNLITQDSVFLSSYQDDPQTTPPEELKLELCMVVPEETEVEGEIAKKTLPGGKYVVANFEITGPEEYGPAWEKVVNWMAENNYEIDMTRPSYEIYKNNPEEHPEKHHIIDICMSMK